MIDRVIDLVKGQQAVGIKNVSINESYFQGHFPRRPVMPGVLIIESMAQTAAVLVVKTLGPEMAGKLVGGIVLQADDRHTLSSTPFAMRLVQVRHVGVVTRTGISVSSGVSHCIARSVPVRLLTDI